jgi:hypothetical protein
MSYMCILHLSLFICADSVLLSCISRFSKLRTELLLYHYDEHFN